MNQAFNFDIPVNRSGTDSIKWGKYKGRDIIPMWVADMDLPSPPPVLDALHARIDHGVFGYTSAPDSLIESVLNWTSSRYGWKIEPEWLVWLPGLVTGINVVCRAAGAPGDEILTNVPVYPPFLSAPKNFEKICTTFPMHIGESGRWEMDYKQLESSITSRTKLLILCSPHNPTGRSFSRDELEKLFEICERNDILVCSDEIHCDLILDEKSGHIPFASLSEAAAKRTITLMAPSKTFNIPGLGCSFAVIRDDSLRRKFIRAMYGIVPHVNLLGYTAAEAAFSRSGDWLDAMILYLRGNRDLAYEAVNKIPGLKTVLPEATYLMWIDASGLGVENPALFFEEGGVGLSDGADFGAGQFMRLNFACSRSVLEEGLGRMVEAVKKR